MSRQVNNVKKSPKHANRVRELARQKRNKKHAEEIKFMMLSLQILAIVAVISVAGYGLDILIGWNKVYMAVAFLIMSIGVSVWYATTKFSKNKRKTQ